MSARVEEIGPGNCLYLAAPRKGRHNSGCLAKDGRRWSCTGNWRRLLIPGSPPRNRHQVRRPWPVLLFIPLATILCGSEASADLELFAHSQRDFLATFLPLRHGVPSHYTFSVSFRYRTRRPLSGSLLPLSSGLQPTCRQGGLTGTAVVEPYPGMKRMMVAVTPIAPGARAAATYTLTVEPAD